MQTTHFRNQLNLRWSKIAVALFIIFGSSFNSFGQGRFGILSGAGSDDQFISYGFFLAGHTSNYQIKYSTDFVRTSPNTAAPNVARITPDYKPGFALGFIGMMKFHDQLHLLVEPKIGFYEFAVDVTYYDLGAAGPPQPGQDELSNTVRYNSEATLVEFPLLLKYRSQRFNNTRMYFLGGGSYRFRTKSQDEANLDDLTVDGQDFTLELGMGFEIYFKYFKFAPEIRFSHGLVDIYRPENTNPLFADAISSVKPKTITIFLNFQ